MRVVRALVAAALVSTLPAAAQRGAEGVIAYRRGGIVYVAAPDGTREARIAARVT